MKLTRTVCIVALTVGLVSSVAFAGVSPAKTPPRGWRSWNAFKLNVNQTIMEGIVDAVAAKRGSYPSLLESGFGIVGLDDGYQKPDSGYEGSWHTEAGVPIIDTTKFPDMKGLVSYAKAKSTQIGSYLNNCWQNGAENKAFPGPDGGNVVGDLTYWESVGVHGLKIDGCGPAHRIANWTSHINSMFSWDVTVENCGDNGDHWSPPTPQDAAGDVHYNLYRISKDISPTFYSTMYNINQQPPYAAAGASRPGTWAYADMSQVGNGDMNLTDSYTHWAAWCVTSTPLVLGFDLRNNTLMAEMLPIITNKKALSINADWAGHPGTLRQNSTSTFRVGVCHGAGNTGPCDDMQEFPTWQVWSKPLSDGTHAVLLLNLSKDNLKVPFNPSVLGSGITTGTGVDVWTGKEIGPIKPTYAVSLGAHDSQFMVFKPSA